MIFKEIMRLRSMRSMAKTLEEQGNTKGAEVVSELEELSRKICKGITVTKGQWDICRIFEIPVPFDFTAPTWAKRTYDLRTP